MRASVTLFRYVAQRRLYPCSITGAPELGYLHLRVHPFNSEVHSVSALLPCFHHPGLKTGSTRLSENRFETYSSSSAFLFYCWAVFYDGGRRMSRGTKLLIICVMVFL